MKGIYAFLFSLLFCGIFSSCQKDTLNEDNSLEISFSVPLASVETRSTTKDALEVGDAFGVLGYCVPYTVGTTKPNYNGGSGVWSLKRNLCPPDVFYKQKVVVAGNGCTYDRTGGSGNNPKYWYRDGFDTNNVENTSVKGAEDYNYSFFAYYPYDGCFTLVSPNASDVAGAPKFKFTMPQNGDNIDAELDHTVTPDAMMSVLYNKTRQEGNLQFQFSHLLTALGFEVNNFSEYQLIIHSIKLGGSFYKEIDIDLTGDKVVYTFPNSRYTGKYTIFDGTGLPEGGYILNAPDANKGETVTSSPSPIGPILDGTARNEFIMLISGTGTSFGDNIKVYLDYTFKGTRKSNEGLTRPGTFTPQPGKKYTAQLNFVGDAFVINFVVDNSGEWGNGAAADGDTGNDDIIFE